MSAPRSIRNFLPLAHQILAEDDCLGNFSHRLASLLAFSLQSEVRVVSTDFPVPLQDSLRTLDKLPGFQMKGEIQILALESRLFYLRTNQETQGRDHADLPLAVQILGAILHVDDADEPPATSQGNR